MPQPSINSSITTVVVCTDISGKKPHRQVGLISGILCGVMVNIQAQNTRHVGSIPALWEISPIFITPMALPLCSVALKLMLRYCIICDITVTMF